MKKMILVIAGMLILVGGGVGAAKMMEIGPFKPTAEELAAGNGQPEKPNYKNIKPPRFIALDPIVISIFQGSEIATTIQIAFKLETMGLENESTINRLKPRLSDAYLRDLHSFIPRLMRNQQRVNVFILKKRLQMISERIAGPGVIEGVLIQSISDTSRQRSTG